MGSTMGPTGGLTMGGESVTGIWRVKGPVHSIFVLYFAMYSSITKTRNYGSAGGPLGFYTSIYHFAFLHIAILCHSIYLYIYNL